MVFYYIFPIFCFVLMLLGYRKERLGLVLILIMLFFSMFRGINVGRDTANYMDEFASSAVYLSSMTTDSIGVTKFEILYNLLCFFVWNNDLPPRTILYVLSIVTFLFLYLSTKRFKVNATIVLFFYVILGYYFHSFNIARQLAALSVGLYAISFLNESNRKRYLFFVFVLLAGLIHNSLVIFVVLYPLRYIKRNREALAIIVFIYYLLSTLIPVTPYILNLMGKTQLFYNDNYGSSGSFAVVERSIIGLLFNLTSGVLLLLIYKGRKTESKTDLLDLLLLLSMVVSSTLTYGNLGTNRVIMSFSAIQCIYFAKCLNKNPQGTTLVAFSLLILLNYYMILQIPDGPYYLEF